jgi:hypothetical protein
MGNGRLFPLFENLLPLSLRVVQKKMGGEWKRDTDTPLANGDHIRVR